MSQASVIASPVDADKTTDNKKSKLKLVGLTIAALAIFATVAHLAYTSYFYEETDDAQIAGHTTMISARVGGTVTNVFFTDNEQVKKDQLLIEIDDRDYKNALDQAAGELSALLARQKDASVTYRRAKALVQTDAVTKQDYDDAESRYLDLTRKLSAQVALVEQAKLNLSYTKITAPLDGRVAKKTVEPGMVVTAGQGLLNFVESSERWVFANFKETQLRRMRLGQKADVTIDAIGGKTFTGLVDSFSPGSGSVFALIPPDNATGNFTKIVQRVPVKIVFDPQSIKGYEDRIVPGLSAIVSVRVR